MNPLNPADWMQEVSDWMRAEGFDGSDVITIDAVVRGVSGAVSPTSDAIKGVLETRVATGFLSRDGSNYRLTEEGEGILYPGTKRENFEAALNDLENYVLNIGHGEVLNLNEYRVGINRRLNPRQAAEVTQAIQVLVNEKSLTPSPLGHDTFIVAE